MLHVNKQKITILDAKELFFHDKHGIAFHEISDITFVDGYFYFISDQGYLYKFFIKIKENKIKNVQYLDAYILKNKKMQQLRKKERDAEGLTSYYGNLLISFERKQRVSLYATNAIEIKKIDINKDLKKKSHYFSKNKGLEAVAYNEKYGVITAPELPLQTTSGKYHTLYSKKSIFRFINSGESIVSFVFSDEDTLLVLLRDFNYLTRRRVTTLMKVYLDTCNVLRVCKNEILAKLDSADGWRLDNFEGLTRVDKNKYLMVSDDNGNILQKTLLVLFAIKD